MKSSAQSGDVRKRQLDVMDVHGPCHGQEGRQLGPAAGLCAAG